LTGIVEVYREYGVAHEVTPRGWVNCACPHCQDHGMRLGFNSGYFCWKCGSHPIVPTLVELLGVAEAVARDISRSLRGAPDPVARQQRDQEIQARVSISRYRRPDDVGPLRPSHRSYLAGRGFDPDRIAAEWGVESTGPVSRLDGIDYRHRILIPVRWGGREVSFQCRDVTGRDPQRYRACPVEREVVHHKYLLYGDERGWSGRTGIAVEGATDCWRLGKLSFAVFGIQYRVEQVREIVRRFDRVAVVFDSGRQAQHQARALAARLAGAGVHTTLIGLGEGEDPGSMGEDAARELVAGVAAWGRSVRVGVMSKKTKLRPVEIERRRALRQAEIGELVAAQRADRGADRDYSLPKKKPDFRRRGRRP
jgi:hypothetical protein